MSRLFAECALLSLPEASQTVVLVDDDSAVLASLKFAFELEGFSVLAFDAAADAIADVGARNVGCLVLDYHLGASNGLDLVRAFRRVGVTAAAIIITSNPTVVLRQTAAEEGIVIVEKPLLGDLLLETVHKILKDRPTP